MAPPVPTEKKTPVRPQNFKNFNTPRLSFHFRPLHPNNKTKTIAPGKGGKTENDVPRRFRPPGTLSKDDLAKVAELRDAMGTRWEVDAGS